MHRLKRCLQNIDLIYFFIAYLFNGERNRVFFYKSPEFKTQIGRHLFGIIQQRMVKIEGKNYSSCKDRSRIATTSRFVTTRFP